jgi:hypothetical protein
MPVARSFDVTSISSSDLYYYKTTPIYSKHKGLSIASKYIYALEEIDENNKKS